MAILYNNVDIDVSDSPWYSGLFKGDGSDGAFQAIENYPYTSIPTVTSTDNAWSLVGTLPLNLILDVSTGIIAGIPIVAIPDILVNAITEYPDPISVAGTDQGTYTYPTGQFLTITYIFTVIGTNSSTSALDSTSEFSISILKDWKADVDSWNALVGSPDKYSLGQK